ncbi:MAG: DnaJ domain-containing protein [Waterburya sp.]
MNNISQSYAILGIKHTASPEATKKAYRNLAKIWHPDRYTNNPMLKAKAEIEIKKLNEAYAVIKAYQEDISNNVFDLDISHLQASITKQQFTPEFFYQQGVTYAEQKKYDDALMSFAQAIKLNADFIEAYQYRGFILSKLGHEHRADAEFRKVHQIKVRNKTQKSPGKKYTPQAYTEQKQQVTTTAKTNNYIECKRNILINNQPIRYITISKTNQIFATTNYEAEIQLWDLNIGQIITNLRGHTAPVSCLTISHTGQTLISGSQDKTIRFWDLKEKKNIRTLGGDFHSHLSKVSALAISPDNQTLFSYDADNCLKIWDINRARVINNLAFTAALTCLAVSPDGQVFCSGGLEPQIRIRQTKTGQVIRSINNNSGVLSLAFSPDGNLLATGGFNRQINLWDLTTGKLIYNLEGHLDRVSTVIFSHDGQTLISSSWDQTIKIWKLKTGKEIASIKAHAAKINTIAIASDNQTLISGSADQTIKLWQCNL